MCCDCQLAIVCHCTAFNNEKEPKPMAKEFRQIKCKTNIVLLNEMLVSVSVLQSAIPLFCYETIHKVRKWLYLETFVYSSND